jgi:glycosyltransferase involved in cell wall biosynthesis
MCSGFALLEAMACGAPVICPPLGALSELIRDGETGFHVDNLDDLMARVRLVASTPALANKIGQNALCAVERDHASTVGAHQLADIYRKLLNDNRGIPARIVA